MGVGITEQGLTMFNAYFNQVIGMLLDNYKASNKTEEALKEVLNNPRLVQLEYVFTFYLKRVYITLRDHVQEEFEDT